MRSLILTTLITVIATPALAQADTAVSEPEPIIVSGVRKGATIGQVDFDKVWRTCAECKRALAQLTLLAKPYHLKKGEIVRDRESFEESVTKHARDPRQAERFRERLPDIQFKDTSELRVIRYDMTKLMASFLSQLEPHTRDAVEAERTDRNLPAVFGKTQKHPVPGLKKVDLTAAVIRRLNERSFTIDLPDPPNETSLIQSAQTELDR